MLSNETRRSLILISKVLQNLSNEVQFGDKEKYMLFINEWISQNQERMQRFLAHMCIVPNEDINVAPLGKEKSVTEEVRKTKVAAALICYKTDYILVLLQERKLAIRALMQSVYQHREQIMSMLSNKECVWNTPSGR